MTEPAQPQPEEGPLPRDCEAVDWWLEKWGRHGVVAGNEPLTREDVEQLIEVNGGTAEGLYLQSRNFQGCDLRDASLGGALLGWANFEKADLTGVDFKGTGKATQLMNTQFKGACLRGAKLDGAILWLSDLRGVDVGGASAIGADLNGALLHGTCLQGANLTSASLANAILEKTNLRFAELGAAGFEGFILDVPSDNLPKNNTDTAQDSGYTTIGKSTSLEGVYLYGATITDDTNLRRVEWRNNFECGEELEGKWRECLEPYRDLKQWYQHHGDYDTAGKFHYREWECKRKLAQQEWKLLPDLVGWRRKLARRYSSAKQISQLWLCRLASGYGELPGRVLWAGAAVIAFFALTYFPYSGLPCLQAGCWAGLWEGIWKSLYFSGVSLTALGYASWAPEPVGWIRYLGVVESLVGISLIALFLVTFNRKMTR